MAVSDEFIDYVIDQLAAWGEVSARRMFGGAGLYCDGTMFGLITDDVAYLKVDDSNREDFVKAGSSPFNPYPDKARPDEAASVAKVRHPRVHTRGFLRRLVKTAVMSYYEIPADVLENPDELAKWAERSLAIARKKK